jgi:hypothetical protein
MPPARAARARVDGRGFRDLAARDRRLTQGRRARCDALRCAAHGGARRPFGAMGRSRAAAQRDAAGDDEACVRARARVRAHASRAPTAALLGCQRRRRRGAVRRGRRRHDRRDHHMRGVEHGRLAAPDEREPLDAEGGREGRCACARAAFAQVAQLNTEATRRRRVQARALARAARLRASGRECGGGVGRGLGALRADALHADERRLVHVHERRQQPDQTRAAAAEPTRRTEVSTPV